uniref:Uncharacterized protein n=1 Tax=Oryza punctata TaxID=4537 RepID=A0A0E0ME98_ORYPU
MRRRTAPSQIPRTAVLGAGRVPLAFKVIQGSNVWWKWTAQVVVAEKPFLMQEVVEKRSHHGDDEARYDHMIRTQERKDCKGIGDDRVTVDQCRDILHRSSPLRARAMRTRYEHEHRQNE